MLVRWQCAPGSPYRVSGCQHRRIPAMLRGCFRTTPRLLRLRSIRLPDRSVWQNSSKDHPDESVVLGRHQFLDQFQPARKHRSATRTWCRSRKPLPQPKPPLQLESAPDHQTGNTTDPECRHDNRSPHCHAEQGNGPVDIRGRFVYTDPRPLESSH